MYLPLSIYKKRPPEAFTPWGLRGLHVMLLFYLLTEIFFGQRFSQ
jgi:hypothetical protein